MLGDKLRRCNLSTTNPKWTSQTLNLGLCDDKLVTNDLMYGAVSSNKNRDMYWLTVKLIWCTFLLKQ